jgi:hypothetical protein
MWMLRRGGRERLLFEDADCMKAEGKKMREDEIGVSLVMATATTLDRA